MDMFVGHFGGNIMFYRNIGTPSNPEFQRELSLFDSLNVGTQSYAVPAFFDIDGNGTLDLFVGKQNGRIAFFNNVGTPQFPRFTLVTPAFQNISVGNVNNPRITFSDIDNDGDQDLFIGTDDGKLYFYRNDGPPGNPVFTLVTDSFGLIEQSHAVCPAFVDIDNDGDKDLFVGGERGGIDLYRNMQFTSVEETRGSGFPGTPHLYQNYPNPFNPTSRIRFSIPATTSWHPHVTLEVFDLLGREVTTLVNRELPAGTFDVNFTADGLSGGVYFYRLRVGDYLETKRFILLK